MDDRINGGPGPETLGRIKEIVGTSGWRHPSDARSYFEDPRGRFEGQGCLIVLPRATKQVSEIVRICSAEGVAIIPYSGGTGVVAGQLSTASDRAIVLSLERMNRIRDILPDEAAMIVEAGCVLQDVHEAAEEHGMIFPLSMASKGSCRIGGNLATNAGGIQVLRYGNARDLCLGIEAVLPSGAILEELSPLRKNNTGYDLRHLLIGSEGTLGVITAACLKLVPKSAETGTACLALRSPEDALAVHEVLGHRLRDTVSALELLSGFGLDLVTGVFPDLKKPFAATPAWALLLETDGPTGTRDNLQTALQVCLEDGLVTDAVVAQSDGQRSDLWDLRERMPEANRRSGAFCSSDTAVPISKVPVFIDQTRRAVADIHDGLRLNSYGHVGDGNIHHNVLPPPGIEKAAFLEANLGIVENVRMAINEVTHAHSGSISAEHGIGRLKVGDLEHYASAARMEALRAIKAALDPKGIMNPGALLR